MIVKTGCGTDGALHSTSLLSVACVSYHHAVLRVCFQSTNVQIQQTSSSSVNVERFYPEDGMLSSSLHFFCLELMWRILRSHPTSKFEPTSNNCYVFKAGEFPNLLTKMVLNSPNQRLWSLPASAKNRLKFNLVKMPQPIRTKHWLAPVCHEAARY